LFLVISVNTIPTQDTLVAGKIAEIGDGYVLLGFASAPIRLTDDLADGFHPGQRVAITAALIDGEFIAQKIVLA
jgi:hypothetical protein